MQNKILIYIVGAVAVLGGVVMLTKNNSAPIAEPVTPMSLKELFSSGKAQKCTFTSSVDNSESSGTVYVGAKKMRGDFDSLAAGQTIKSHMVVDGMTSYVWTDAMNQGFKMEFDSTVSQGPAEGGGVDVNEKVSYNCSPWIADGDMFKLPRDIKFDDMATMMRGMMDGSSAEGSSLQCNACNQAPDEEGRSACKAAMGCK